MAKKTPKDSEDSGLLKATAAAIGGIAGKVAAMAKSVGSHEQTPARTVKGAGKLSKKNKTRLPRRQKKALAKQKAAAASAHSSPAA